jgi:DNA-binding response OmpR family regulator
VRTLSPEKGGRIPAATLTACPCEAERLAEWRRAGFQRHVPKPFAPDDLVAIVDELAGRVVERRTKMLAPVILPRDVRRERRREWRDVRLC